MLGVRCSVNLPGTTTDDFVMMKTDKWNEEAVEKHLQAEVQLSGWKLSSARARVYDWCAIGGRTANAGTKASSAGSVKEGVSATPEEICARATMDLLAKPESAAMSEKEKVESITARTKELTGENEMIECESVYGKTMRSHGPGQELRRARLGEEPDVCTQNGAGIIKISTGVNKCVSNLWSSETEYMSSYADMLEAAEDDGKLYVLKRIRDIHEFAMKLPDAQQLPYLKRLWKESPCGVPAAQNERLLAKIKIAWANSLEGGMVKSEKAVITSLEKKMAKMEATLEAANKEKASGSQTGTAWADRKCFCCGKTGHVSTDCPMACKTCSTPNRAARIGSDRCTCGATPAGAGD